MHIILADDGQYEDHVWLHLYVDRQFLGLAVVFDFSKDRDQLVDGALVSQVQQHLEHVQEVTAKTEYIEKNI